MDESLEAALDAAEKIDRTPIAADEGLAPAHADDVNLGGRDATLDEALTALRNGASRPTEDGLIDLLGAELLESVVVGNAAALDAVSEDVYRAQQAAEQGSTAIDGGPRALELAETTGALRALSWLARLGAEQLAGPALIDVDSHAGRVLTAIAERPGVSNTTLSQELDLDKTEVSRTGRRLLEAGLAVSARVGKTNAWRTTPKGEFTLTAITAAARSEDPTTRPLIADAVDAFGNNGYEVVPDEEVLVDDIVLEASDDGDMFIGARVKKLALGAARSAAAGKVHLTDVLDTLKGPGSAKKSSHYPVVLRASQGHPLKKKQVTRTTAGSRGRSTEIRRIDHEIRQLEARRTSLLRVHTFEIGSKVDW